ncbi:AzlC family ABC transporter permease [Natronoglycomyces albus]|uniref:AzlC family ABC transporter permease n=1 Tax=Natronoglycomyces albus TaxID=2811108 RepID=A0A895XS88_9ACTN|nr:AzlC family ABC transporter permease [Natronoglycomyces albus]QSB04498.1 AzlC family ABC transporter permease [Natronoglycomyces albus]
MSSAERTKPTSLGRELARDLIPLNLGMGLVGVSFGALAVSYGSPWWIPCAISLLVFAGGSQFLAVGVIAAGGGPLAAVIGGIILNARHLPYGLAIAHHYDRGWITRLIGSHVLIDQSTAFALANDSDPRRAQTAFWATGLGLFFTWNVGTLVGALAGQTIGDPEVFGLDAALPAALIVLVLPSLRDKITLRAAVLGATIALVTYPFLPPGLPVLFSLLGLVVALPRRKKAPVSPQADEKNSDSRPNATEVGRT